MTLVLADLVLTRDKFQTLFPLETGKTVIAGGKRAGQTAGMARYIATAGKEGRAHTVELGYGTVPARSKKPKDYPLLLPRLDSELGRFNIDGNTHNVLILTFAETDNRKLRLESFRRFGAPCAIDVDPARNGRPALAVLEIAQLRIRDILENKLDPKQDPQLVIQLIRNAIDMRAGHAVQSAVS